MKGFIEVTYSGGKKILININRIEKLSNNVIYLVNNSYYKFEESYEQIKQLIKEAQ